MKQGPTGWECPCCQVAEFWEWELIGEGSKAGGRWCPSCGYGVHPPAPVEVAS